MKCPITLSRPGIVSALGTGIDATKERLFAGDTSGMLAETGWLSGDIPISQTATGARFSFTAITAPIMMGTTPTKIAVSVT